MGRSGIEKNVIYAIIPNPNPKESFWAQERPCKKADFAKVEKTGFPCVSLVGNHVHLGFVDSMLNHFAARPTGQELRPLQKGPNRGVDDA